MAIKNRFYYFCIYFQLQKFIFFPIKILFIIVIYNLCTLYSMYILNTCIKYGILDSAAYSFLIFDKPINYVFWLIYLLDKIQKIITDRKKQSKLYKWFFMCICTVSLSFYSQVSKRLFLLANRQIIFLTVGAGVNWKN